jgi:hypothetical protein
MSRTRKRTKSALPRCVLARGGLTALAGGSHRGRAWIRWVVEHDGAIRIPAPILVECTTGDAGRDAEVNRIVDALERAMAVLVATDEATARRAGKLRHLARGDDGIDALVAAVAVDDGSTAVLLTSDPDDLGRLLEREPQVHVRAV